MCALRIRNCIHKQKTGYEISECEWISGSEEHMSELQSHSEISYAVFCLKKKRKNDTTAVIKLDPDEPSSSLGRYVEDGPFADLFFFPYFLASALPNVNPLATLATILI